MTDIQQTSPLVIAHRGFSGKYPQNTTLALQKAAELGVDYIELDVSLSSDEQVIVFHDSEVSNLTDGEGFIKDLTLMEIKKIDAGVKFASEFAGLQIPTLSEAILSIADSQTKLCVEIKARENDSRGEIVEKVLSILRTHDYLDKVIFTSYNREVVKKISQNPGGFQVGLDPSEEESQELSSKELVELCRSWGADTLVFDYLYLTKNLVKDLHQQEMSIFTWTVDDPEGMQQMINAGVDGVMTNRPDLLKKQLP